MIQVSKFAAAGAALVLALTASSASARIITATYTGKVVATGFSQIDLDGALDATGEFGGDPIEGSDFTAVIKFNTTLGLFDPTLPNQFLGGSIVGGPDPVLSAILTINGFSQAFSGATATVGLVAGDGTDATSLHLVNEFTTAMDGSASFRVLVGQFFNPNLPFDLRAAVSLDRVVIDPDSESLGAFVINASDADGNATKLAYGYLAADHLTVTSDGVPEPATWAMMLIGFGALGSMARRRRALAAA